MTEDAFDDYTRHHLRKRKPFARGEGGGRGGGTRDGKPPGAIGFNVGLSLTISVEEGSSSTAER